MSAELKDPFMTAYRKLLSVPKALCRKEFTCSGDTYGEVFSLAAGLKKTLSGRGAEKSVCLCTENKAVFAASLLAALAGGCNLILPYSFSTHALLEMYEATGFDAAIADRPEEMPGVEMITPTAGDPADLNPGGLIDPDRSFLKLFTGGSTGQPRVWSKTPRNLFAEAFYLRDHFGLTGDDVFLATVPPYHIYGLLFSILLPLVARARVLPEIYTFPQEILSTVNRHRATVLVSVPISYRSLRVDNLSVPSLRLAFSSSGPLDRSDARYFLKKTGLGIHEIYGSTETGGVASRSVSENTESWQPAGPVSWRMFGRRLAVRSDFVSSEMERDAEGFCVTGDEVQPDRDGRFLLLGRADGIVKVAGKRVDLQEVQNKIQSLPTVRDAVVIALPAEKGRESEIAALVACDLTEIQIKKMILEKLEPYAMPRRFHIVSSIRRTATGKIDYRRVEQIFLREKGKSQ
ncbi:MAG: fatty acid--CoA ligase family protein [Smithellaceae bacterium]|jgi:acyl-coenzyme A synthetase/AMP-(fatty) acid ligase|nr:fatty acid--CoA ligase family protein [Smithellaceae bacterium]MDD3258705.1 fatty acid--CoA ligase family protein [Smithellaceae bacterium]MDD3848689.1 fatty acid--CoA ligase family protein [Smithellaceae bacterium]